MFRGLAVDSYIVVEADWLLVCCPGGPARPTRADGITLSLCAVSVARAEPGVAKGSAAAFARVASFFNLIAFSLGGVFFAVGFLVALSMWFWRENCGLPPRGAPKFRVRARAGTVSPGGLFRCRCCGLRFYVGVRVTELALVRH